MLPYFHSLATITQVQGRPSRVPIWPRVRPRTCMMDTPDSTSALIQGKGLRMSLAGWRTYGRIDRTGQYLMSRSSECRGGGLVVQCAMRSRRRRWSVSSSPGGSLALSIVGRWNGASPSKALHDLRLFNNVSFRKQLIKYIVLH